MLYLDSLLRWCGGLILATQGAATVALDNPAPPNSVQPHLATTSQGQVVMSWVAPVEQGHQLQFARYDGRRWSRAVVVSQGHDWFINWADFPSVVPLTESRWAAHWLVKREGRPYAYDVALSWSTDGGSHWSAPWTPHRDDTPTEHGFVSLLAYQSGLMALWLDGRYSSADHGGRMTLRAGRFAAPGRAESESEVDARVCDCCQTDAASTAGGLVVVYRDRSEDELRDISLRRFEEGAWSEAVSVGRDGWRIEGCPVNGPAVAADENRVAVAWYSAAAGQPRVHLAVSEDGGRHFGLPITMASDAPLGRVDVVLLDPDRAALSWMAEAADQHADLMLAVIDLKQQRSSPPHRVASMRAGRVAGFPQMALLPGGDLLFAWTGSDDRTRSIQTYRSPVPHQVGSP